MEFNKFLYMQWAKRLPSMARFNLTNSGMPQASIDFNLELEQLRLDCSGSYYGDPELLEKLSKIYQVPKEHILVTYGTSMANFLLASLLLSPEDSVLVEVPTYEALVRIPEYLKAKITRIPRTFENQFQLPLNEMESLCQNVKAAFLTNPHNPSQSLIPEKDLQYLADLNSETLFIFDEVYLDFLPNGARRIAHLFSNRFFTTGSLTKVYGFGGLRIGWIIGPPEWIAKAYQLMDLMEVLVPAPTSHLACLALDKRDTLLNQAQETSDRGWRKVKKMLASTTLEYFVPAAGLSCLIKLPEHLKDDVEFSSRLMTEEETLVVPGSFFEAPGFIRLSYGCDLDTLSGGLERIKEAIGNWPAF